MPPPDSDASDSLGSDNISAGRAPGRTRRIGGPAGPGRAPDPAAPLLSICQCRVDLTTIAFKNRFEPWINRLLGPPRDGHESEEWRAALTLAHLLGLLVLLLVGL